LNLQARARAEQRPTDELIVLYVLERFLYRVSQSRHRQRLVLKGGMLLAAFNERRPRVMLIYWRKPRPTPSTP
jgi:hypothetical protein